MYVSQAGFHVSIVMGQFVSVQSPTVAHFHVCILRPPGQVSNGKDLADGRGCVSIFMWRMCGDQKARILWVSRYTLTKKATLISEYIHTTMAQSSQTQRSHPNSEVKCGLDVISRKVKLS